MVTSQMQPHVVLGNGHYWLSSLLVVILGFIGSLVFFLSFILPLSLASLVAWTIKNLPAMQERQLGLIPGSGRSPGEGNGNPLKYACLENSLDRETWQATVHEVANSQT